MKQMMHAIVAGLLPVAVAGGVGALWSWWWMVRMPGRSYQGPPPALRPEEVALREELRQRVDMLAGTIGERNLGRHRALAEAADFIDRSLSAFGYRVQRQLVEAEGRGCYNLEGERRGSDRAKEIVVVGAHYDSVPGSPGADDNASGVAAMLALARVFAGLTPVRSVRFVAFVNEEAPYFSTPEMGSLAYATRARERGERIIGMVSLETIGYYTDEPGSQRYPSPFQLLYPSTGNFIGLVANLRSRDLLHQLLASFRRHATIPSEGIATVASIPGVSWSDQWAFWQAGYPALMVTDTAPYRYPHYHTERDTPDKLEYDRLARVVYGLQMALAQLAGQER